MREDPVLQQILGAEPEDLTPEQKRIISDSIDAMSEEEIEENLRFMRLSTRGSIYLKRERLKIHLGATEPPDLPEPATSGRITIENASEGEYLQGEEDENGVLKLRGRIRVGLPGGVFYADTVIVDTERQEVYGEGNVVYRERNTEVRAERIIFDRKLNTGIVYNAAGYTQPVYFIGETIAQVSEDRFAVSHVYFTTSAAKTPHYSFSADRLYVYDDNKIFASGVWYHVGGVPLVPLPFLYSSNWGTGVIAQVGHSDLQGWFVETTYQFSVPDAFLSGWLPTAYRVKADWHEIIGEQFGVEFFRFSPGVNYFFDLGVARYKRYGVEADARDRDNVVITNQVTREDGTIGTVEDKWYKIFALLNLNDQDLRSNNVRSFHVRYEDYAHFLYEYEFGGRYIPEGTIPALYANSEAARGLVRPLTNWNLVFNEVRDDFYVRVQATQNNAWQAELDFFEDSEYEAVNGIVPAVDVGRKWFLGTIPVVEMPVYWNHNLHTDLTKEYAGGDEFKNLNNNSYETGLSTFISFGPYLSFSPTIGYGAQKTVPDYRGSDDSEDIALSREARKNSYQYVWTEDELQIGPPEAFLRATYRGKNSYKEEENDAPTVNLTGFTGNQKTREVELLFQTTPVVDMLFSVSSVYDMREFEREVEQRERWFYPVFRTDIYIDFKNPFRLPRENLMSRNKVHFIGLRLTNDYVYDPVNKRDHSNVVGVSYEMGGFDLWFLKRLRYFEFSAYWYHVYYNPELDHIRFALQTDVQLWSWGYLELELESRATDVERYQGDSVDEDGESNHVSFTEDIANGAGFNGAERRQDSVFNVAFFRAALILDLEDWEYRFGYELEQRTIFGGVNTLDVVTFYDNRIFFSLTLLRFDLGGVSSRPSRFLINRYRVRSSDIGRQPIERGAY